jgi:uncharacterized protein
VSCPMRRTAWASAVASLLGMAACASPGRAAPKVAPQSALSSADLGPLIRQEIKDDADLARIIRESYTKYEMMIPMRDGIKLFTDAYIPKDASRTYPILMIRTPYSVQPYGVDAYPGADNPRVLKRFAPSANAVRDGFIFVHQDVRGKMMSEGSFVDVRPLASGSVAQIDESTDAYDTIDWLTKNLVRNNGKVGAWGVSYPGFYAAQAAVHAHPALRAVSPQAPVTDWFQGDDFHHNGAFFLGDSFDFYVNFGKPRPVPTTVANWNYPHDVADAYEYFLAQGTLAELSAKHMKDIPFWSELMQHGSYDAYWKARNPRPHYRDVKPAMLTVGGAFDAEDLFGALETYRAFETQSAKSANNFLVMGPWRHGGWARTDGDRHGDVSFGQKTSQFYREHIELPFFQKYLKDAKVPAPAEATVFETGTNEWKTYAAWPPREGALASLYLGEGGTLASTLKPCAGACADSYISDPERPVPYRSRSGGQIDADYMSDDQRFASQRPDVLTYKSQVIVSDLEIAGPVDVELWISTTGTDADFIVKLIDVASESQKDPEPNPTGVKLGGYQQLVRAEVMRGKFRDSLESPAPFKPGEKTRVKFTLPDVSHAFRPGHRMMVQVQSTWFPLVDINPQTFTDIYTAKKSDFQKATQTVHRQTGALSRITMRVLTGKLP